MTGAHSASISRSAEARLSAARPRRSAIAGLLSASVSSAVMKTFGSRPV